MKGYIKIVKQFIQLVLAMANILPYIGPKVTQLS